MLDNSPGGQWLDTGEIKTGGDTGSCAYAIRLLTEADLAELIDFHGFIHSGLSDSHILRRDDSSYLRRNLSETGITLGAIAKGRGLLAYAALAFPKTAIAADLCHDLSNLNLNAANVAVYDGSAVHPVCRGAGLHDHLNQLRRSYAATVGAGHLLGTVSLLNPYSLRNHLQRGFVVRGIREKYGGMLRLIIHSDLNSVFRLDNSVEYWCELNDPIQHGVALQSDCVGYRVERRDAGWLLSYARLLTKEQSPSI